MSEDPRLSSPSARRNRGPILEVLRRVLPESGGVLEIASGSGEHVCHFAAALPRLVFQPSDPDESARRSIRAWITHTGLANVRPPLTLHAEEEDWPLGDFASGLRAVLSINMIHIAPWSACLGLLRGASLRLPPGGLLMLYGPFKRGGRHTAPSNELFDIDLKRRNPAWGLRDLDEVAACAEGVGMNIEELVPMPTNNLSLVLRRMGLRESDSRDAQTSKG